MNRYFKVFIALAFLLGGCFKVDIKPAFDIKSLNLPEGLVYYYTLDNHLYDSSPNRNNASSKSGTVEYVTDRNGKTNSALSLNGANVEAPRDPAGSTKGQGFSVSFYVNLDGAKQGSLQQLFMARGDQNFLVQPSPDKLRFILKYYSESQVEEGISYDLTGYYLDKWINVILTFDKEVVNLYIDKKKTYTFKQVFATPMGQPSLSWGVFGTAVYYIGTAENPQYPFYGKIDEIMGFNRTLTDQEVASLP